MSDDRISDDAVHKATGADWSTWFSRLDEAGAQEMPHPDIAKHIHATYQTPHWWCQMVTVQYERARGMRAVNEAGGAWQFSKQRTFELDVDEAFHAVQQLPGWNDLAVGDEREFDFGPVTIRRVDHTLIRMWIHEPEGRSTLEIWFHPRGEKTAILFAHAQIPSEEAMSSWKKRWTDVLAQI